jgi:hypothetical protein
VRARYGVDVGTSIYFGSCKCFLCCRAGGIFWFWLTISRGYIFLYFSVVARTLFKSVFMLVVRALIYVCRLVGSYDM